MICRCRSTTTHHMTWISALTHFAVGCTAQQSRAGPHNCWRAAAAGHDGALRTSLPCSPPWIPMDFNGRAVRRITFWIILWGRNAPCGTGAHWRGTMIDTGRTQALYPECERWEYEAQNIECKHTHTHNTLLQSKLHQTIIIIRLKLQHFLVI